MFIENPTLPQHRIKNNDAIAQLLFCLKNSDFSTCIGLKAASPKIFFKKNHRAQIFGTPFAKPPITAPKNNQKRRLITESSTTSHKPKPK